MQIRRAVLFVIALGGSLLARPVGAQRAADGAPVGCTYERCALRVEPAFFSAPKLVRGRGGELVGRLGAFGGGVDTLLTGPDSAARYARRYVTATRRASTLALLGTAAYVVVLVRSDNFRDDLDGASIATAIAGVGFAIASIPFALDAHRSLSRAVWFYNAALPRSP